MSMYEGLVYAAPPPKGVAPDFSTPVEASSLITIIGIFVPLAAFITGLRLYSRIAIIRKVTFDDYLMIAALIFAVIMAALILDMLNYGLGKHMWDVPLAALYPKWMFNNVLAAMFFCAATGLAKGSILLFYLRIFPNKGMVIATWSVFAFTIGFSIASVFVNLFSCSPINGSWELEESLTAVCIDRPVFYFAQASLGIAADVATVVLPLPMLKSLHLPLKQKLGVAAILTMGAFVCVISIVRLQSLYTLLTDADLTMNTVVALLWCVLELNLSIIGGSIPAIKPFLQQFFPKVLGSSYYGRNSAYNKHSQRYYVDESQRDRKSNAYHKSASAYTGGSQFTRSQSVSTRTDHGDAGSEEYIMQDTIVKTVQYAVQYDQANDSNVHESFSVARATESGMSGRR